MKTILLFLVFLFRKRLCFMFLLLLHISKAFAWQKPAASDSIYFRDGSVIAADVKKIRDTSDIWQIETTDGNEYIGKIVAQDNEKIILQTESLGQITIQRKMIKSMQPVSKDQLVNGEIWFRNPHDTRYFFSANGYGLRAGEGYYQNTWIFLNQLSYAPSDNFTIGLGTVPLFLFGGSPTPIWITPKLSLPLVKDKFNVGFGGFLGTVLGEKKSNFGIVYGTATMGSRRQNLSLSLGYGYSDGGFAKRPTMTISGMARTGKRLALISENYFISSGDFNLTIISAGCRFLGNRIAVDGALFAPLSSDFGGFIALPWLSILVPFSSKKT